ncbi:MAG TPA: hypothetical protein VEJ63_16430 [Planctomycetota bacterium]|nr:hypothetical protein [Planctomycetota bacterium]
MTACESASTPFVQTESYVVHHEPVSSRYFLLRLRCPEVAKRSQPGQFVMLACTPDLGGSSGEPLLPRPLAILDARGDEIELLYFVAGKGTALLKHSVQSALASGRSAAPLRIIGPLGRGFEPIPDVDIHVGVGGGSGVAPLVYFLRRYGTQQPDRWHLILAARSAEQLARRDVVGVPGTLHQATDDGSVGFKGNGVQALEQLLNGEFKGKRVGIYAAGPEPMMEAAAKLGRARKLPVRVSLEARMACGVGVCRACVVDGTSPHKKTGLKRRTVCQDGPVFDIDELAGW